MTRWSLLDCFKSTHWYWYLRKIKISSVYLIAVRWELGGVVVHYIQCCRPSNSTPWWQWLPTSRTMSPAHNNKLPRNGSRSTTQSPRCWPPNSSSNPQGPTASAANVPMPETPRDPVSKPQQMFWRHEEDLHNIRQATMLWLISINIIIRFKKKKKPLKYQYQYWSQKTESFWL